MPNFMDAFYAGQDQGPWSNAAQAWNNPPPPPSQPAVPDPVSQQTQPLLYHQLPDQAGSIAAGPPPGQQPSVTPMGLGGGPVPYGVMQNVPQPGQAGQPQGLFNGLFSGLFGRSPGQPMGTPTAPGQPITQPTTMTPGGVTLATPQPGMTGPPQFATPASSILNSPAALILSGMTPAQVMELRQRAFQQQIEVQRFWIDQQKGLYDIGQQQRVMAAQRAQTELMTGKDAITGAKIDPMDAAMRWYSYDAPGFRGFLEKNGSSMSGTDEQSTLNDAISRLGKVTNETDFNNQMAHLQKEHSDHASFLSDINYQNRGPALGILREMKAAGLQAKTAAERGATTATGYQLNSDRKEEFTIPETGEHYSLPANENVINPKNDYYLNTQAIKEGKVASSAYTEAPQRREDYNRIYEPYSGAQKAYNVLMSRLNKTNMTSADIDQAYLQFDSMLHNGAPGSLDEAEKIKGGQPVMDMTEGLITKIETGKNITEQQRNNLKELAQNYFENRTAQFKPFRDSQLYWAGSRGVDPNAIIPDFKQLKGDDLGEYNKGVDYRKEILSNIKPHYYPQEPDRSDAGPTSGGPPPPVPNPAATQTGAPSSTGAGPAPATDTGASGASSAAPAAEKTLVPATSVDVSHTAPTGTAPAPTTANTPATYPDWMDARSRTELAGVNSQLAQDLLEASRRTGIHFSVTQGMRTQKDADYYQNVTHTGISNSQHLWGAAMDVKVDGGAANYRKLGEAYEAVSAEHGGQGRWGGHFRERFDPVHFDMGEAYAQRRERTPYGGVLTTPESHTPGTTLDAAAPAADRPAPGATAVSGTPPPGTPQPAAWNPIAARMVQERINNGPPLTPQETAALGYTPVGRRNFFAQPPVPSASLAPPAAAPAAAPRTQATPANVPLPPRRPAFFPGDMVPLPPPRPSAPGNQGPELIGTTPDNQGPELIGGPGVGAGRGYSPGAVPPTPPGAARPGVPPGFGPTRLPTMGPEGIPPPTYVHGTPATGLPGGPQVTGPQPVPEATLPDTAAMRSRQPPSVRGEPVITFKPGDDPALADVGAGRGRWPEGKLIRSLPSNAGEMSGALPPSVAHPDFGKPTMAFGDRVVSGLGLPGVSNDNASPQDVLASIRQYTAHHSLDGQNVVLSSGMSNRRGAANLPVVRQQIDALREAGAHVTVLGVGPGTGQTRGLGNFNAGIAQAVTDSNNGHSQGPAARFIDWANGPDRIGVDADGMRPNAIQLRNRVGSDHAEEMPAPNATETAGGLPPGVSTSDFDNPKFQPKAPAAAAPAAAAPAAAAPAAAAPAAAAPAVQSNVTTATRLSELSPAQQEAFLDAVTRKEGNRIGNNPGNLRYAPWERKYGATGTVGAGFAQFPSASLGREALHDLLFNKGNMYYNMPIGEVFQHYAPASDKNDPVGYANEVVKALGGVSTSGPHGPPGPSASPSASTLSAPPGPPGQLQTTQPTQQQPSQPTTTPIQAPPAASAVPGPQPTQPVTYVPPVAGPGSAAAMYGMTGPGATPGMTGRPDQGYVPAGGPTGADQGQVPAGGPTGADMGRLPRAGVTGAPDEGLRAGAPPAFGGDLGGLPAPHLRRAEDVDTSQLTGNVTPAQQAAAWRGLTPQQQTQVRQSKAPENTAHLNPTQATNLRRLRAARKAVEGDAEPVQRMEPPPYGGPMSRTSAPPSTPPGPVMTAPDTAATPRPPAAPPTPGNQGPERVGQTTPQPPAQDYNRMGWPTPASAPAPSPSTGDYLRGREPLTGQPTPPEAPPQRMGSEGVPPLPPPGDWTHPPESVGPKLGILNKDTSKLDVPSPSFQDQRDFANSLTPEERKQIVELTPMAQSYGFTASQIRKLDLMNRAIEADTPEEHAKAVALNQERLQVGTRAALSGALPGIVSPPSETEQKKFPRGVPLAQKAGALGGFVAGSEGITAGLEAAGLSTTFARAIGEYLVGSGQKAGENVVEANKEGKNPWVAGVGGAFEGAKDVMLGRFAGQKLGEFFHWATGGDAGAAKRVAQSIATKAGIATDDLVPKLLAGDADTIAAAKDHGFRDADALHRAAVAESTGIKGSEGQITGQNKATTPDLQKQQADQVQAAVAKRQADQGPAPSAGTYDALAQAGQDFDKAQAVAAAKAAKGRKPPPAGAGATPPIGPQANVMDDLFSGDPKRAVPASQAFDKASWMSDADKQGARRMWLDNELSDPKTGKQLTGQALQDAFYRLSNAGPRGMAKATDTVLGPGAAADFKNVADAMETIKPGAAPDPGKLSKLASWVSGKGAHYLGWEAAVRLASGDVPGALHAAGFGGAAYLSGKAAGRVLTPGPASKAFDFEPFMASPGKQAAFERWKAAGAATAVNATPPTGGATAEWLQNYLASHRTVRGPGAPPQGERPP